MPAHCMCASAATFGCWRTVGGHVCGRAPPADKASARARSRRHYPGRFQTSLTTLGQVRHASMHVRTGVVVALRLAPPLPDGPKRGHAFAWRTTEHGSHDMTPPSESRLRCTARRWSKPLHKNLREAFVPVGRARAQRDRPTGRRVALSATTGLQVGGNRISRPLTSDNDDVACAACRWAS